MTNVHQDSPIDRPQWSPIEDKKDKTQKGKVIQSAQGAIGDLSQISSSKSTKGRKIEAESKGPVSDIANQTLKTGKMEAAKVTKDLTDLHEIGEKVRKTSQKKPLLHFDLNAQNAGDVYLEEVVIKPGQHLGLIAETCTDILGHLNLNDYVARGTTGNATVISRQDQELSDDDKPIWKNYKRAHSEQGEPILIDNAAKQLGIELGDLIKDDKGQYWVVPGNPMDKLIESESEFYKVLDDNGNVYLTPNFYEVGYSEALSMEGFKDEKSGAQFKIIGEPDAPLVTCEIIKEGQRPSDISVHDQFLRVNKEELSESDDDVDSAENETIEVLILKEQAYPYNETTGEVTAYGKKYTVEMEGDSYILEKKKATDEGFNSSDSESSASSLSPSEFSSSLSEISSLSSTMLEVPEAGAFTVGYQNPLSLPFKDYEGPYIKIEGEDSFVLAEDQSPIIVKEGKEFVQRNGLLYEIKEGKSGITVIGRDVPVAVLEKVTDVFKGNFDLDRVMSGSKTDLAKQQFYSHLKQSELMKSFVATLLIRPQDGKLGSFEESNYLFKKLPGEVLRPVLIDLDEVLPSSNESIKVETEDGKGIQEVQPIRLGLMALPNVAMLLGETERAELFALIDNMKLQKKAILQTMSENGKPVEPFQFENISALEEVLNSFISFGEAYQDKPFTLEDLCFFILPSYKKDWNGEWDESELQVSPEDREAWKNFPREMKANYIGLNKKEDYIPFMKTSGFGSSN